MIGVAPGADAGRIVICTTSFPESTADGREAAGAFVLDFARSLSRHRAVSVVAPAAVASRERCAALDCVRFPAPRLPLSLLKAGRPSDWPAIHAVMTAGWRALRGVLEEGEVSQVFALWALPSGLWARRAWRRYGTPYSVWALGSDIWSLARLPLVRGLLRGVLRDARRCYADGYGLCDEVAALAGRDCGFMPSARRLMIPDGVSRVRRPPYRLAFLGRWHPNKGIDLLLHALAMLNDEDWCLIGAVTIAGGGPLREQVQAAVEELQGRGRPVRLASYLDKAQALALLRETDYLLIPSRIESIPVIFSDAAQAGTPVIATPVGDQPRLLAGGGCGILAAGAGAEALVSAIRQALRDSPARYREGLLRVAADFDVDASVAMLLRDSLTPAP